MSLLSDLVLVQGETTATSGRIYARLPLPSDSANYEIFGKVIGPYNKFATTLPATIGLVNRTVGDGLLAESYIPDPCAWSIDSPSLYNVDVQLSRNGEVVDSVKRRFGFRCLGVRGQHFVLDGKRWTLRSGRGTDVADQATDWSAWRALRLARWCERPTNSECRTAAEEGVMLLASVFQLPGGRALEDEIRRLAAWPSVVGVVTSEAPSSDRSAYSNLMLGWAPSTESRLKDYGSRADFLCLPWQRVSSSSSETPSMLDLPIVAVREKDSTMTGALSELRRECDRLQRDLAPLDLAGYAIVENFN